MKKISLFICALVFAFASANAQTLDRSKAPTPGPAPKINIGEYKSFELKNGLKVFVIENNTIPRVSIQLSLDIDPIKEGETAGYVSMAGSLMKKGTKNRTKDQINETVDFIGASFFTSSGGMFGSSLTKHQNTLLEVMSDVLMNPTFPAEELEKAKKETISGLASNKTDPDAISGNVANVLLYGKDHPYGELVTEKTVEKITLDQIKNYYNTYYKPNKAYLIILGDIKYKDAKKLAKKYFGEWEKGDVPTHEYDMPVGPTKSEVALVDKVGAIQSVINITYPINLKPGSDDAIKARMMNTILGGGGFNAYLMQNIREDKGWTYGAYSRLASDETVGYFAASAKVRNNVTDSAVVEFLAEMDTIRNKKVDAELLQLTKNKMTGSFARSLESPQTVAGFALNIARYNLPSDYYETYLQKVATITQEDIQMMAKKYIRPEQAYIEVVGSTSELKDKMAKFGKATIYDIYGKEVKEDPNANKIPAGLTAEKVIENYLKARGGRAKIAALKDIYTETSMNMGGQSMTTVLVQKAPDKMVMIQKMGEQEVNKQIFTPEGMSMKGMMGSKEITGDDYLAMKHKSLMSPELDYAKYGYKLELVGTQMLDGKKAYKVEVVTPGGDKEIHLYDVESGLLVQNTSAQQGAMTLGNYKNVDGVMFPYTMTVESPGGPLTIEVQKIEVNKGIDDKMFE
ncbi:MAG: putative Zn-dependent peptidase [Flammeovirgaceae bacterium]|jgi:zinc protease